MPPLPDDFEPGYYFLRINIDRTVCNGSLRLASSMLLPGLNWYSDPEREVKAPDLPGVVGWCDARDASPTGHTWTWWLDSGLQQAVLPSDWDGTLVSFGQVHNSIGKTQSYLRADRSSPPSPKTPLWRRGIPDDPRFVAPSFPAPVPELPALGAGTATPFFTATTPRSSLPAPYFYPTDLHPIGVLWTDIAEIEGRIPRNRPYKKTPELESMSGPKTNLLLAWADPDGNFIGWEPIRTMADCTAPAETQRHLERLAGWDTIDHILRQKSLGREL